MNAHETLVGKPAPAFELASFEAGAAEPRLARLGDYAGRWLMLVFYPRDFSFVCPTELTAFSARMADFRQRNSELLGISVDSIELHREWLTKPVAEGGLGPLQFPLASDCDGAVARAYHVWVAEKEVSTRGLFLIDPEGALQYAVVHNLSVGRSPDEVLRVLDALQTGGLCPASWTSADGTIDLEKALLPGRILGHYRIRRRLGSGTFGTVFAAWDLRLERMVALKILRRNIAESREALLSEARAAARLAHPNICTVFAVEEEDGLPVIAMEFLDGKLLTQVLAEGLSRQDALRLAGEIAAALAAAHRQNVVHGDLKPANVMVTAGGVKILDFGLASSRPGDGSWIAERGDAPASAEMDAAATVATGAAGGAVEDGSDQARGIYGTPAYMSPEQAAGLSATPASDVFSFGLTLFELLTGRRALREERLMELLFKLQLRDLGGELSPQVDEPYRQLLAALLARDPARRPPASDLAQLLMEKVSGKAPVKTGRE